MRKLFLSVILFVILSSCSDSNIVDPILTETSTGIVVLNEGLFGQNNSGLTYYDLTDNSAHQDVYYTSNGKSLGDTGNDIEIVGDKAFISVDNSNKIEVVDMVTFQSKGFLDLGNGASPRQIVVVDENNAYVTSLYGNEVIKFNPTTLKKSAKIGVNEKPEGILVFGNNLFVANSGFGYGETVSIISTVTDSVLKEISVPLNPRLLVKDSEYIYVSCSGLYEGAGQGAIVKIDPISLIAIDTLQIDGNPGELVVAENFLFVVNSAGVNKINLNTFELDNNLFLSGMELNTLYGVVYSIAYDDNNQLLMFGNPKDFVQNGEVLVYDLNGTLKFKFDVGLNPGDISVYKK